MSIKIQLIPVLVILLSACNDASMAGGSNVPAPISKTSTSPSTVNTQTATPTPTPTPSSVITSPSAMVTPTSTITSSPNGTPNPNGATPLTGLWDAQGYTCDVPAPTIEVISITQTATQFVGTKVTGDPCVPAGYISFQGTISTTGALSLNFNEGEPGQAVVLEQHVTAGTYTPTLININGDNIDAPSLTLTPHQN